MRARLLRTLPPVHPILLFLLAAYAVVITRTAWLNEDAYITLRTVDNFVQGYGLRWNIAERVQTFTHPLWLMLITVPYFVTREAFYTVIFLSVAVSTATYYVLALHVKSTRLGPEAAILTIPILSKAYVDYSTSGFENPLTHLLWALFLLVFLDYGGGGQPGGRRLLWLSLLASLAVLNRMDTALLFAPALALALWKGRSRQALKHLALGLLPLVAWELFSIIYYGFPFPNTAYAKLNTSIPLDQLVQKGLLYVVDSLWRDPLTVLTITLGLAFAAAYGRARERTVALGMALYLGYVVVIGADYMSGRFFSVLVLGAVILLARYFAARESRGSLLVLAVIAAVGFAAPMPTLLSVNPATYAPYTSWGQNRIDDWRLFSFLRDGGLVTSRLGHQEPSNEWAAHGRTLRDTEAAFDIYGKIGFAGYFAGPKTHILDPCALSDPLLARLKPLNAPRSAWQSGHFPRAIPAGYEATLRSGTNQIEDEQLRAYFEQLAIITRGPIFSAERAAAIWKMNTGQLQHLLADQPVLSVEDPACDF